MIEKEYGLIGNPLVHSFSQRYFNEKFTSENIPAQYLNFELQDIGELMEMIAEHPKLQGFNVTIPYKEQIIPYLDEMDDLAKKVGAVNVVKIIRKGKNLLFKGYNSDVVGFRDSLKALLNPNHKKALILGTGGASKAVEVALEQLDIESIKVSRSVKPGCLTYADITEQVMSEHLVIVNTTPLGMYPEVDLCPDIPYEMMTPDHFCYDLIYNPDITKFMELSARKGAAVKNGLEMLLLQAFESWRIWTESKG
ncbi:MAG: shikimate dehydrogenase [Muribaculaceae bacterium]|nr:shikimate dehydrogenase [Muribaculaceae bacterium]